MWDVTGLPPAAQARRERLQSSPLPASLLPAPSTAAIAAIGLEPVGEVMGCIVQRVSWQGYTGCTYHPADPSATRSGVRGERVVSSSARFATFRPYLTAQDNGYSTALRRMTDEAGSLGADGVIGVRLTVHHRDLLDREFLAVGTAVRARSLTRPPRPFTTDLAGTDVAKLLVGGWAPVAMLVAVEVCIRHDDRATRRQARSRPWRRANVEVSGYTELVQRGRGNVRDTFAAKIRRLGADGAVASDMSLRVMQVSPSGAHTDHVAEAVMVGTAIARVGGRRRPGANHALCVLPARSIS